VQQVVERDPLLARVGPRLLPVGKILIDRFVEVGDITPVDRNAHYGAGKTLRYRETVMLTGGRVTPEIGLADNVAISDYQNPLGYDIRIGGVAIDLGKPIGTHADLFRTAGSPAVCGPILAELFAGAEKITAIAGGVYHRAGRYSTVAATEANQGEGEQNEYGNMAQHIGSPPVRESNMIDGFCLDLFRFQRSSYQR